MNDSPKLVTRHPWFKMQGEGEKQYRAFCIYKDMGADRTTAKAFMVYRKREGENLTSDKVNPYFLRWFKEWKWIERAKKYDDYADVFEHQKRDKLIEERASVWIKRREELREEKYELGKMMFSNAREILEYPVREATLEEDGKTYIVKPAKWIEKSVAATLAKSGCDLTSDLASIKIEIPMEGESLPDLSRLTEEELVNLRNLLQRATPVAS